MDNEVTERLTVFRRKHSNIRWTLLLGCLGLAWGTTIPLNKLAVAPSHSPVALVFWQQLAGFALLLTWFLFRRWTGMRRTCRPQWRLCIIVASLGTLLPHGLSFVAVGMLQANMMSIGIAITPMAAYLIALMLGSEAFSLHRSFGLILGTVAVLLLLGVSVSVLGQGAAWGIGIALLPGLCYAAESNVIAGCANGEFDPVETLFFASGLSCLFAGILNVALGTDLMQMPGRSLTFAALTMSGLLHVICYAAYFAIVARTGAVFASQVAYFVTFGGFLSGTLFLAEAAPPQLLVSMMIMIIGVGLVQPRRQNGKFPRFTRG